MSSGQQESFKSFMMPITEREWVSKCEVPTLAGEIAPDYRRQFLTNQEDKNMLNNFANTMMERLNQFMNKAAKESVYNVYVELANDQMR